MRFVSLLIVGALLVAAPSLVRADDDVANLYSPWPKRRAEGAANVAARGLRRTIPKLIAMLDDDEPDVRLAVVLALHRMRAKAAVPALLVRAQIDRDVRVREAASKAVLRIRPRSFASKLGSADPPPVALPPPPPLRQRARYATHFTLGARSNVRRADESVGGTAGFALRWGDVESQLSLGYPAMSLGLRLRWLMIRYPRFTPYLVGGALAAFNNDQAEQRTAVATFGGLGLRWYIIPPIFLQLEVVASYTLHAPTVAAPEGSSYDVERFSVPVTFEIGLELWP